MHGCIVTVIHNYCKKHATVHAPNLIDIMSPEVISTALFPLPACGLAIMILL